MKVRAAPLAWLLWLVFALGLTVLVVAERERRSVTPVYREAAAAWQARRPLYGPGIHGFLYFPSAAVLYAPFGWLPGVGGGVAWRWAGLGVLASGVWRLAALGGGARGPRFLLLTLLTLPVLTGSARAGQMNVPIAGLLAHATADLVAAGWWRAAFSLALGLALKPTVLPMTLLAAALYPAVAWRFGLLAAAFLALPVATVEAAYAREQYADLLGKLRVAGEPGPGPWQDLTGLVRALGHEPSAAVMTGLRAAAAVATLAVGWLARRRSGPERGAVLLLALGTGYILLWNPRTEGVTYLLMAPAVGVLAAWALEADRRAVAGWLCVAVALVLAASHLLTPGKANTWMRPAAALVFVGYVVGLARRPRAPLDATGALPLGSGHTSRSS